MFVSSALFPPQDRLPDDFAIIVVGLCRAMFALCYTDLVLRHVSVRLIEATVAMQLLFDRWREGRIRPARKQPQRQQARPAARNRSNVALPRRFAWLRQYLPETAIYADQLQQLLADPEIAALVAQVPQAGKILRPICRMLGVQPIPQILTPQAPNPAPPPLETPPLDTPPESPHSNSPSSNNIGATERRVFEVTP